MAIKRKQKPRIRTKTEREKRFQARRSETPGQGVRDLELDHAEQRLINARRRSNIATIRDAEERLTRAIAAAKRQDKEADRRRRKKAKAKQKPKRV